MYQFTEDCLTGIDRIDEEHRQLFSLINEAFELLDADGASAAAAKNMVRQLKAYAENHFAHEEAYMEQNNDPELALQKKAHADFAKKVEEISLERLDAEQGRELMKELLLYLSRWLYSHILGSDIMIGKFLPVESDSFLFADRYRTGIDLVDEEHAYLFEIIRETNEVVQDVDTPDRYDKILDILDKLKEYTVNHFQDEEAYMEKIAYEALPAQRHAHQAFIDKLSEINLFEVDENQQEYLNDLIEYLRSWLVNHILRMDKLIPVEQ